jgi:hypothetical protein
VVVAVLGVLGVAEPALMSVLPVVEPAAAPLAPIEVPLPVVMSVLPGVAVEAVESVLPVVPDMLPVVSAVVLLVVSLGVVVDGIVVEDEDEAVSAALVSSFLPQADRDRAAIRARAAHCAIGDLIIRNSFGFRFGVGVRVDSVSHCLRLTLVRPPNRRVVCYCRTV